MVDSCFKGYLPFLLKTMVLIGIWRRGILFLSNYLVSFWHAWSLSNHLSSFWCTQCKNLSLYHIHQWRNFPVLPVYSISVRGKGLQDLPSGSLDMLQISSCLLTLEIAPTHLEEPVGVHGTSLDPRAPVSSA